MMFTIRRLVLHVAATAACAFLFILSSLSVLGATIQSNPGITLSRFIDNDKSGDDSPGDELLFGNNLIMLHFKFVGLSTQNKKVDKKFDGYYLDSLKYREELFFSHPDWKTESKLYPTLKSNDVVGLTAFVSDKSFKDEPFLWMWNAREPSKSTIPDMKWISNGQTLNSYEWYTLYEKHEERSGSLVLVSNKSIAKREEIQFDIEGKKLVIRYSVFNLTNHALTQIGIIALPSNRIIDTVFAQPDLKVSRKTPPAAFSDSYTLSIDSDGLIGSGMLFWSRDTDSLLHMDGLYSWHKFKLNAGESITKSMTVSFMDKNIDAYYSDYLRSNGIKFDEIDWEKTESYLVSKVPFIMMKEGYVYHAYDYNPPGTNHDWHNEMTGRAFIAQYLSSGNRTWLDYAMKANRYYIDRMQFKNPQHICYGYYQDQTYADKNHDCYPWSQPYNVESLIAEYAVTKDPALKKSLLLNFEKMYDGPLFNKAANRWYWTMKENGTFGDFGVFDAQEFGADVMISAYEFTGDKKYLDRAVEVIRGQKHALENFGLLLEDRAGEPSVNTFAFAAKVLFKLYEYTGDKYWLDRAVKVLNATIYSRVYMEAYSPEDAWLNGALARKDGDWKGQYGAPTTGTDSSVTSQTSYIPWVMEALVAGYNHTGNSLYIKYIAQMLHHQLEANKRLASSTAGKFELCGHYNMFNGKFLEDDDGLTVVSNLFLFPYVKAFYRGVRSPHSSVVLLPGKAENTIRAFHLSGRSETIRIFFSGRKDASIRQTDVKGKTSKVGVKHKYDGKAVSFKAAPYSMYEILVK